MTDKTTEVNPKISEEAAFEKFKMLYNEVYALEADIKDITERCKTANLDGTVIKAIAKAVVYGNLEGLVDKYNLALKKIEDLT
jgi:uncharacterized protein (UPF0335 family)